MKKFLDILCLIGLSFDVGWGLLASYSVIMASMYDWKFTWYFNRYHEGMIELILFPVCTVIGVFALFRLAYILTDK